MKRRGFLERLCFSLLLIPLAFSGCASLLADRGTAAAEGAVIGVVNNYLTSILNGRSGAYEGMIIWPDYIASKKGNYFKQQYLKQVELTHTLGDVKTHPLSGLKVEDVAIRDDRATVKLQKLGVDGAATVEVKLLWNGGGWLIVGDNIFGDEGIVTEGLKLKTQAAPPSKRLK